MNRHVHAKMVGTIAEDQTLYLLQEAGYRVTPASFSLSRRLLINGTLRVKVKSALWTKHAHSKGRYQFCIHQDADVYILCCLGTLNRYFIVPSRAIGERTNVAIWSEFPSKYTGRWSEYCDNWAIIDQELTRCQNPTA